MYRGSEKGLKRAQKGVNETCSSRTKGRNQAYDPSLYQVGKVYLPKEFIPA
jgi:hypothetical protein